MLTLPFPVSQPLFHTSAAGQPSLSYMYCVLWLSLAGVRGQGWGDQSQVCVTGKPCS